MCMREHMGVESSGPSNRNRMWATFGIASVLAATLNKVRRKRVKIILVIY